MLKSIFTWWNGATIGARFDIGRRAVLVGKDTRLSGYMFEAALEAGFTAAGVNVMLIGPLPTPGIAYLTKRFECDFGVVISASHNLYDDNGIKFFDGAGSKLSDELEEAIERELESPVITRESKSDVPSSRTSVGILLSGLRGITGFSGAFTSTSSSSHSMRFSASMMRTLRV